MRLKVSMRRAARARSLALAKSMMRQKAMKAWMATRMIMIMTECFSSAIHSGPVAPPRPLPATSASMLMKATVSMAVMARAMRAGMKTLKWGRR
jgi:hypothetical protein